MTNWNISIFNFLHSFSGQSVWGDKVISFCAQYLGWFVVASLIVCLVIYSRRPRRVRKLFDAFVIAGVAWGIAASLKYLIYSPRPFEMAIKVRSLFITGGGEAFPSGHTTFFTALGLALWRYDRRLSVFVIVCALVISITRIIAGVHWPIDVVGGWLVAILVVLIMVITRKVLKRR